jgi:hypothetical protein
MTSSMFFSPWTRCSWLKLKPNDQASGLLLGYEISLFWCLPRFNNCSHGFGTVSAVVGAGTTMIETHKLKISQCTHCHKLKVHSQTHGALTNSLCTHTHKLAATHTDSCR